MKNKYYKLTWLEQHPINDIVDLIQSGMCSFEITGSYGLNNLEGEELLELEYYKNIQAKTDEEAIKNAKKFIDDKYNNADTMFEIFSLVRLETETIFTEEDLEN